MKFKNLLWSTSAALILYNFSPAHASIQQVPNDVLALIFSYLTPAEAAKASSTSKQFCELSQARTKELKEEAIKLIQKFCDSKDLYGYQSEVKAGAIEIYGMNHAPSGLTQDQFAIAKLNAINLLYGITIASNKKKEYETTFKNIYSTASPSVKQMFESVVKQFK